MAWMFWKKAVDLFGTKPAAPPPRGEVALTTCWLADVDPEIRSQLSGGDELTLAPGGEGRLAAMLQDWPVGYVPGREAAHVARLLEQGAQLGCRVVSLAHEELVLVRIFIRM